MNIKKPLKLKKNNIIWIKTQKCAGTSFRALFSELNLLENRNKPGDFSHIVNMGVSKFQNKYPDFFDKAWKFTVVRNPWARVLSAYLFCKSEGFTVVRNPKGQTVSDYLFHKIKWLANKNISFEQSLKMDFEDMKVVRLHRLYAHSIPLYKVLADVNGKCDYLDFVCRFENLKEDFKKLRETIGLPDIELPHIRKTSRPHYSTFYTEETKQLVAEKYKKDIELFGYEFEDRKK